MKCNEELIHTKALLVAHYNRKCMYSSQNFYWLFFEVSVKHKVLRRWKANV